MRGFDTGHLVILGLLIIGTVAVDETPLSFERPVKPCEKQIADRYGIPSSSDPGGPGGPGGSSFGTGGSHAFHRDFDVLCRPDGHYKVERCINDQCWCFDEDTGEEIPNTEGFRSGDLNCEYFNRDLPENEYGGPYDTQWTGEACEGQTISLWCEAGMVIEVTRYLWGRRNQDFCAPDDPQVNTRMANCASAIDLRPCEGKNKCDLHLTNADLGVEDDPCPGVFKQFHIDYMCRMPIKSADLCYKENDILTCDDGDVLKVFDALYAGPARDCMPNYRDYVDTFCHQRDALETLASRCDGRQTCMVIAEPDALGESCRSYQNSSRLQVDAVCGRCENYYGDDAECDRWAANGECEANPQWMNANCRKACWNCDNRAVACEDTEETQCPYWAALGECGNNRVWMTKNCPKSCKTCPVYDFVPEEGIDYIGTVCEVDWMYANCGRSLGFGLRIDSILFGRLDEDTCPHSEIQTTDCPSPAGSLKNAAATCNGREFCMLGASAQQWGDPCPGTYKYLSVGHRCQECKDVEDASYCQNLLDSGMCKTDQERALDECFATCTGCQHASCSNVHSSDADCDKWAVQGECDSNPSFMKEQCKESCRFCSPDPNVDDTCINLAGTLDCSYWADVGECERNPYWMLKHCTRACDKCQTPECFDLNLNCLYWASIGECEKNPDYMLYDCNKACKQCTGMEREGCFNSLEDDALCNTWANQGACPSNPIFMNVSCQKSCGLCVHK